MGSLVHHLYAGTLQDEVYVNITMLDVWVA